MNWRTHLAVLALLSLLTLAITYPLPVRMGQVLAGDNIDAYINPWADWWTYHVLSTPGEALYHTDYMFYPDGVSLVFHSFSHTNTVVSLALQPLLGQPAAYNVTILLAYLLSAYGMYFLIAYLTGSTEAGLVAGAIFAFNPYHVFESSHPVLVSTQWMPITVLFLMRWLRERKWRLLVLAAFFFLLNALTSWHLMTFLSLWLVVYGVYYLAIVREPPLQRRVTGLVAFVVAGALLVLPFIWPLIRELLSNSESYVSAKVGKELGMDLLTLIVPPWTWELPESVAFAGTTKGYLGIIAASLAGLGALKRGWKAGLWWGGGLLFLVIAVGPDLSFGGRAIDGLSFPWSRVFVPLLRRPFRFQLLVTFGLAGAAGYGWTIVRDRLGGMRWKAALPVGLAAVLILTVLDFSRWPFPTVTPIVSPFYERLASEPGEFAIAPFPANRQNSKYHLYYQTIHGKKILGGVVSRTPVEASSFMDSSDVVRALRRVAPDLAQFTDVSQGFTSLADLDIRYVVFHKDQMSPQMVDDVREYLMLRPAYEDLQLMVFRTDLQADRDYVLDQMLTPALGLLRAAVSSGDRVRQGTIVDLEIYWAAPQTPERDLVMVLKLVDPVGGVAQVTRVPIGSGPSTTHWEPGTLIIRSYRVRVNAAVAPGQYDLRVGVGDALTGEQVGDTLVVETLEIQEVSRNYDLPVPEVTTEGCFADRLCALGYDSHHEGGQVVLVTYWRANRLMQREYVISARLVDPISGAFVCQKDAAPRDWTYPTTWWDVGEIISESMPCEVVGLDPGRYDLEVAVYEAGSGEVLPVSSATEGAQSTGQVLLLGEVDVP